MAMRRTKRQTLYEAFLLLWKDIKDIRWAIMLIIAYFVLGLKYLYSLCPMVMITGFPCPGCGLTRAGFRLLRLDFTGAFRMHPFIYLIVVYAGMFGWNRYVRKQKMGKYLNAFLLLLMIGMVIFYIWRMANYFPGDPPMSYYRRNLLRILAGWIIL